MPIATATDGGGSIRIPAAFCGLVGMKGTFGRIPRGPRAMNGQLTSSKGCLARSVRDTARWFDITSGYHPRDPFSLPRIDGWEANLGQRPLKDLRVAYSPDLGNAVVHPAVERIVHEAADALIDAAQLRRVELDITLPENGIAWARAGLPSLVNDLKGYWPDCKDDLTFEIRAGMEFAPHYRAWHAASIDRFRVQMNEALADLFENIDILLCPVSPMEPFAAEGPMPRVVGETKVSFNAGALTIPGNIAWAIQPSRSRPASRRADCRSGCRPTRAAMKTRCCSILRWYPSASDLGRSFRQTHRLRVLRRIRTSLHECSSSQRVVRRSIPELSILC